MTTILSLANPIRFLNLTRPLAPWIGGMTLICITVGLYLGLIDSPPDYQQGDSVRIMYVHVPAAWMAMFCYTCLTIFAAILVIWKHPLAEIAGTVTAPIGAVFTFLALFTGSFWGKPIWGTWWVWDARLTSVLILFFLYIGYIALSKAFENKRRGAMAAAMLALVGFINIPIIKFSVEWWSTLHQPASVIRIDGPSIHPSMLWPLLFMAIGYTLFYIWSLIIKIDLEVTASKIRVLQQRKRQN